MYLAPKKQSFVWRFRTIVGFLVFVIFLWFGGGRIVTTVLVRIVSLLPRYNISFETADEVAILRARISDLLHERDALAIARGTYTHVITAGVSISPGYFFGDALIIDRGADVGVSSGDLATTEDGIILGTVEYVDTGWSSVRMLSRPGSKTTIRLSLSESTSTSTPTKNILTEAEGVGGGELRLDVPSSLVIEPGSVVWWGEHPDYPIGVVDRVDESSARQIETVFIRLPISLSAISRVFIVRQ